MIQGTVEIGTTKASPQPTVTVVNVGGDKCMERENCSCCQDENKERGNWSHPLESRLATIGFAFGLNAIHRFPYIMHKNGGAAFLVPYVVSLLVLVIPFAFVEMALGQFTSQGILTCWQMIPIFKGLGVSMLVITSIYAFIVSTMQSYILRYLGETVHSWVTGGPLPWASCKENWDSLICDPSANPNVSQLHTSTQELQLGPLLGLNVAAMVGVWVVIALVLVLGIKSLGKVSYFTTILPFVLLIPLLVRAYTLPGSDTGRSYLLTSNWEKLSKPWVWLEAMEGAVFDSCLSLGGYLTLASYNKFHQNIVVDVFLVAILTLTMSMLGGVMLFSFYGYQAELLSMSVEDVVQGGLQTTIIGILPTVMSQLPTPHLYIVLFFIFCLVLSAGVMFGLVETIATAVVDQFPKLRRFRPLVTGVLCLLGFLLTLPLLTEGGFSMMQRIDMALMTPSILTCIILAVCFAWYAMTEYHPLVFKYDLGLMLGKGCGVGVFYIWSVLFGIGTIVLIPVVVRYDDFNVYYSGGLYGCVTAAPIVLMLIAGFVVVLVKAVTETTEKAFIPSKTWGPRLYIHRVLMLSYWRADRIDVGTEGLDAASRGQMLPLVEKPPM